MKDLWLACVVGARPNFVKMAPLLRAFESYPYVRSTLIHTGQHYDGNLSDVFFDELGLKPPNVHLGVGSGSHAAQTARVLERFEQVLQGGTPDGKKYDWVVVVGDVNSTMSAALAAAKLNVKVAHVEAGLRSFDRSMPEEINRIVTDSIADELFVSEPAGMENLRREGHAESHLHLVGNVMIDTLMSLLPRVRTRDTLARFALQPGRFGVVTLHRPANVDSDEVLCPILQVLEEASLRLPLVFPVHPRTKSRIEQFRLGARLGVGVLGGTPGTPGPGILQVPPLGYLDFLALTSQAKVIVTDSGGLQEESTALGIPCLTVRPNTERPITVDLGTSTLVGNDPEKLRECLRAVLDEDYKKGRCPELWDGRAAGRIAAVLARGKS